jgi:hypothetical protein
MHQIDVKALRGEVVERTLSRRWLMLAFATIAIVSLVGNVSLAAADHNDYEELEGEHEWGYGPERGHGPEGEDGPEEGEGPQCSPEWLREWYLWEDPEDEEDWWYFWQYKWCQTPGEEDWVKSYGDWYWWAPAGEDEVDELLEGLSE